MRTVSWLSSAMFILLVNEQAHSLPAAPEESSDKVLRLKASAETGFLGILDHKIQQGKSGTYFKYHQEGGQDVLFPITRFALDLTRGRHTLVFLYQPLALETRATLTRDIIVNDVTFTEGTPMRFFYGFPYYRISWLYDLNPKKEVEVAVGLSFQIRNATIEFQSLDGLQLTSSRNVGPVPILKFRLRHAAKPVFWWGFEADGFYAPISYLNGSDNEVVGAILDSSLRCGLRVTPSFELFLNLRYLGGGSVGTSEDTTGLEDGYTRNWIHLLTVTAGFGLTLSPGE